MADVPGCTWTNSTGDKKENEKVMDPWGQKNVGWINKTKDFGAASPTDWNLG